LAAAYARYLSDAGLADSTEIFQTAASAVNERDYRFNGLPLVLLDLTARSQVGRAFISELVSAAGPVLAVISSRECVEIARSILSAADRGVPFDAMAVLL